MNFIKNWSTNFRYFRSSSRRVKMNSAARNGLSLLEVLLSIAILGAAMVVIGNMYFLGARSALRARLRSDANIMCDAKMAELAAGFLPLSSANEQPIPENQEWAYSVDIQPSIQRGLLVATVTVQQANASAINPISLSIVRFIPDPDYEPEEDGEN